MTKQTKVTSGPGKYELLQSVMQILDQQPPAVHVMFTIGENGSRRGARITGIRGVVKSPEYIPSVGDVWVDGYFFEGISPYEHHGTQFSGHYNPVTRNGFLQIHRKKG